MNFYFCFPVIGDRIQEEEQGTIEIAATKQSLMGLLKNDEDNFMKNNKTLWLYSMPDELGHIFCHPNRGNLEIGDQFTISFFIYSKATSGLTRSGQTDGVVQIYFSPNLGFTIAVMDGWLALIGTRSHSGTKVVLAKHRFPEYSKPGWFFTAITYANSVITFHNSSGHQMMQRRIPRLWPTGSLDFVRIGPTMSDGSVACLSVFNAVLNQTEIDDLKCVCRNVGKCPKYLNSYDKSNKFVNERKNKIGKNSANLINGYSFSIYSSNSILTCLSIIIFIANTLILTTGKNI